MVAAVRGVVTSDLMFSMVSSGMGATVCTAGRFLLVAPLTKDEDEEEDEEAESVAPGRGGKSGESDEKGKCVTAVLRGERLALGRLERWTTAEEEEVLMSDQMRPKLNFDGIWPGHAAACLPVMARENSSAINLQKIHFWEPPPLCMYDMAHNV